MSALVRHVKKIPIVDFFIKELTAEWYYTKLDPELKLIKKEEAEKDAL